MERNRVISLKWIGLSEGGYVNHPRDPGGATDRGITQRTFNAWNRMHGRALRPVRGISKSEAESILVMQYFQPVRFNDLPDGLDYAMADYSTNSGPAQANRDLQRVLRFSGRDVDGVSGVMTLAAVRARSATRDDVAVMLIELCNRRMSFLRGLSTFSTFGRGWTDRVMGARDGYQRADRGVIDRGVDMALGIINTAETPPPVGADKAAPDAQFPPRPAVLPTLRQGDKGAPVRYAQALLERAGYPIDIDGDFGPKTAATARQFQRDLKLRWIDAIIGLETWAQLER